MSSKKKPRSSRRLFTAPRRTATTVVNTGITPFPPRFISRMKYVTSSLAGSIAAGFSYDHRFNLNSLFSPEYSGGHQPYGYDQLCGGAGGSAPYSRYRVFATGWRVSVISGTNNIQVIVIPNNSTLNLTAGSMENYAEQPRAISKLNAVYDGACVMAGGIRMAKLNGCTEAVYNADDRFQAGYNAKPTEDLMLHVVVRNVDSSSVTAAYALEVALTFQCEFFDPNTLVSS